jgi:hypothetical protein
MFRKKFQDLINYIKHNLLKKGKYYQGFVIAVGLPYYDYKKVKENILDKIVYVEKEPTNKFDKHAMSVTYVNKISCINCKIGYIRREDNKTTKEGNYKVVSKKYSSLTLERID